MFYIVYDKVYEIVYDGFDSYDKAVSYIHIIEDCVPDLKDRFGICNVNMQKVLEYLLGNVV